MADLVHLKNVVKRYKRGQHVVEIFHKLNFSVLEGEFLALMGPSGSGKTTLLNMIGGLDSPDRGEITAVGHRIDQLSMRGLSQWRARYVGIVFQFYNLLPMLSVEENVEVPLNLTPLPAGKRKQHVRAALELVGLEGLQQRRPNELSGGQQQRVAIARAIVADPTLLICDEPTGDLDRESADAIMRLFQQLNQQHGKTIVMVTHDPLAAGYASRKVMIDKSHLIDDGNGPDPSRAYENRFHQTSSKAVQQEIA
jgi:putative ABC transport system ATP-binding protein